MRRQTHNPNDAIGGQDSFLDIVANLVGILIILVVVVSAHASSASKDAVATDDLDAQYSQKQTQLKQLRSRVKKMTIDNHQLEHDIVKERRLTKALADERHAKLMLLEQARQSIKTETENWESYQKEDFEAQIEISNLKQQLTSVHQEMAARENQVTEINRIESSRISHVPMDELVEQMKAQWQVVSKDLENSNQTVATVGPIENYRLQYKLKKKRVEQNSPAGPIKRDVIKFDHFVILPTVHDLGETVDSQLFSNSQFISQLSGRQPEKTTISIWVYPDSFSEFMNMKKHLHQQGFQVASWPLEFNRPISGGPNGFKTSAQ